ncbi:MAG: exopolyphosphatase [Candidatus Competibacterales bacterium]|nr:exopolyphosphatase [Candidatus Competibacterales bacterium]
MPTDNIAAIDLGSNSFHMIIARLADGQLQVVDRLKEMVQLAAGLDENQQLTREARERALACLAMFGQRLRQFSSSQVRVVGTNTLRQARNGRDFIDAAEEVLGHPVEIISGREEARLIYLGVAHTSTPVEGRRLVIDIGGGSTELIVGEGFEPQQLESLYMGCVSMTRRHLQDRRIRERDLQAAELNVRLELEPVRDAYERLGWQAATGASGTIKAIRDVVTGEGWSREGINRESLHRLRAAILSAGSVKSLAGRWELSKERASVFTGGFVVLHGIVETFGIERLEVSDGALREGAVYDLLGRIRHEDVRERTIAMLSRRYTIDEAQARRVAETAQQLYAQVREDWDLAEERFAHDLQWAAELHELGLAIAHSQYHKHGSYILHYSDLPGFSRSEQQLLAVLVRGHRRKFPLSEFEKLPGSLTRQVQRLCVLLRLAVLLHRGHRQRPVPTPEISARKQQIRLQFPPGWLDERPLTQADLETEANYLKKAGYKLSFT